MSKPNWTKDSPSEMHTCLPHPRPPPPPLCLSSCVWPRETKSGFVFLEVKVSQKCKQDINLPPPQQHIGWLNLGGLRKKFIQNSDNEKKEAPSHLQNPEHWKISPLRSDSEMPVLGSRPSRAALSSGWLLPESGCPLEHTESSSRRGSINKTDFRPHL